ncbi:MAG: hypothetical protein HOL90_01240 [Candidatus Nitrosopelagicus sp.]|jgi:hypothetical protein|nr:hypothetical protein [Candidatus Nitrosopelagicus sp.]
MVEQISDTIKNKLKEICKDPSGNPADGGGGATANGGESDEFKLIMELLEKTSRTNKQTKSTMIKKEFQLLIDQYFPYREDKNE